MRPPGVLPRLRSGTLLLGIAAVHGAIVLVACRRPLGAMLAEGLVGSLHPDDPRERLERESAFWCLVLSAPLAASGALAREVEGRGDDLPAVFGYALAAAAVAGGAVVPASGFWSLLGPAALVLRRAHRAEDRGSPSAGRAQRYDRPS